MQFTRFTDYALRVLIYVGQRPNQWVTIREVSDAYGISRNHLMKVVSFLGGTGYLLSQRGPGGGVRLQVSPAEIRLAEVILHTEGSMDLLPTPGELPGSLRQPHAQLELALGEAAGAFIDSLNDRSLADVLHGAAGSRRPATALAPEAAP